MNGIISGENIDTAPLEGLSPEEAATWYSWRAERTPHIDILHFAGLYKGWENATDHSLIVNGTAVFLALKIENAGTAIDVRTVDAASLLHDAAIYVDKKDGISYADEQESSVLPGLLAWFGYSSDVIAAATHTGRVKEMYIGDEEAQKAAISDISLEQLVVAYADARVRNTKIVSLKEARDKNIAKMPADIAEYALWYSFYKNVEARIMEAIGDPEFTPENINQNSVTNMVSAFSRS